MNTPYSRWAQRLVIIREEWDEEASGDTKRYKSGKCHFFR